jgi:RNA polymerase sigma-70 factor, ECF subfamily
MRKKTDPLYEKILIDKIRESDQSSFSIIFTAYYSDLVQFAGTFIQDLDTCEEIVQDAFVDIWEKRQTLIILTSLKSYLLKMIQNRCIDWLRHLNIRQEYNTFMNHHVSLIENDTENYVLFSELKDTFEKALDQLPAELSSAFKMNRQMGLTYLEIAAHENVSVRTIEVRIGKTLQMLRELLKDYLITILLFMNWIFC